MAQFLLAPLPWSRESNDYEKERGKKTNQKDSKRANNGKHPPRYTRRVAAMGRLPPKLPKISCPKCALKPPPNQPTHGIPDAGSVSSGQRPCPQARAQDAGYLYLKHPEVSCFQTSLKMNGWNLQITHLERNMIETNPPWLCSMLIFRGV